MEKAMKAKKKIALKIIASALAILMFLSLYYLAYVGMGFFRFQDKASFTTHGQGGAKAAIGQKYTLLTYNIGFGAYNEDTVEKEYMEASDKTLVMESMDYVVNLINATNPCFVFLQEVDADSTRSCYIDQPQIIADGIRGYDRGMAPDYETSYLLYPLNNPIGKNYSGTVIFSKCNIDNFIRRSLPIDGRFASASYLDRGYSVSRVSTDIGNELILYNFHLSPYKSGSTIDDEQLEMLLEDMKTEYDKGNYVIAAGDFSKDLLGDSSGFFVCGDGEYDWAKPIKTELFPECLKLYAPTNAPSRRSADRPYKGDGSDFVAVTDGIIASDNIEVVSSQTIDTGFAYSDHNPVKFEIILK